MVEHDEAKIFKALMEGIDAILFRVTMLQILMIILMGINIVILMKVLDVNS